MAKTTKKKAPKPQYNTPAQFKAGLVELRRKALEWAHDVVDQRETQGSSTALRCLEVATSELNKQIELEAILDEGRSTRKGYQIQFMDDSPQAEA